MSEVDKILVIDDSQTSLKMACKILGNKYRVTIACNGQDGLKKAYAIIPDVILLDVEMPGLNGYEVCDQLKNNAITQHIPIVFLSAHRSVRSRMQGYEAGADDYLTKPFDKEDLLAKINVCHKYQQQRLFLQASVNEAKKTAYTAMTSTGKLGQVMKFIEKSADAYDYTKLAEMLIEFINKLQLKCLLVFSATNTDLFFSSTGNIKPLETELIIMLRQEKRFYDFGCRTQVNFPRISMLIKNMPLDNMELYGQIKDLLPSVLSAAELKIKTLNAEQVIKQQVDGLIQSFTTTQKSLYSLRESLQTNHEAGTQVMRKMLQQLSHDLPNMGLEEDQEQYVLDRIDSAIDDAMDVITAGDKIRSSIDEVLSFHQSLIDSQNNLVDTIIHRNHQVNNTHQEDTTGSVDIELF